MLHASTSPFYPLFAALDVNAKMHQGKAGRQLWQSCVTLGIEARKAIFDRCEMILPFVPEQVNGQHWQDASTIYRKNQARYKGYTLRQLC